MKYLIIILLGFSSCEKTAPPCPVSSPEPIKTEKFAYSQKVIYKVPAFYKLVCSGKGVVYILSDGLYGVYPGKKEVNKGCPSWFYLNEKDIKAQ